MTSSNVRLELAEEEGVSVLAVGGEVDLESSPRLREMLLGQLETGKPLLVDLAAVEYIDSSGIATLVEAYRNAQDRKLQFALIKVSESVMRVLELARLDQVFAIHASSREAFDSVR
ncbi:MAG: STAS domain-containing protein [Gammaproteobacteria bacterium]